MEPTPKNPVEISFSEKRKLVEKVNILFDERIKPFVPEITPEQTAIIKKFQQMVFIIDHYYEHSGEIDELIDFNFWKTLTSFLLKLNISESDSEALLQDIKDYAKIEAATRQGIKLSSHPIKDFYFKKSCDVRMQRHIARILNGNLPESSEEEIIKDILQEIEDDVDDLEEDRKLSYGGNRLLEILREKNSQGLDEYKSFVETYKKNFPELVEGLLNKINNINYV